MAKHAPNQLQRAMDSTSFRRWFWRPRQRIGPGFDRISGRELRKLLRQYSWRRAH